jgi:hypothetical protein
VCMSLIGIAREKISTTFPLVARLACQLAYLIL